MSRNDTVKKTFLVATGVCLVCAVVISTTAVMLRPMQEQNELADFRRNILDVGGLLEENRNVQEQFEEKVETRVVDLETGRYTDDVDPASFDQQVAAQDPGMSESLSRQEDIAGIQRRENYAEVYLVEGDEGRLDRIILPIRGYGLWGTLYGFLALDVETYEVVGIGYYEHQETPGLGGEVDNPRWKAQWEGKELYGDEFGEVAIDVVKGDVDPEAEHRVEAISGATLTSRGVENMLHFWLGEQGYAEYLRNLRAGEA